jgi:flagellar M-ring protein FliF
MNFDERTRTEETYGKNSAPNQSSVRSQQNLESSGQQVANGAVPGALTNQPPAQPLAPLNGPLANDNDARQLTSPGSSSSSNGSNRRESTVNYEVDKAIEYLKANKGQLRRVSAAVVVNYKPGILKDGQPTPPVAYSADELLQINSLVKDAVGYVERRGDTVSVANIPFSAEPVEVVPFYKEPAIVDLTKELVKFGLLAAALIMVYLTIVRTLIAPKKAAEPIPQNVSIGDEFDEKVKAEMAALDPKVRDQRMLEIQRDRESRMLAMQEERMREEDERKFAEEEKIRREESIRQEYEDLIAYTTNFVKNDPQVVALLFKNWVSLKEQEKKFPDDLAGTVSGGNV